MELKPRSDGRRTKASLPEKRVVAGRQSSAERCKANVSSLEPVSSSGTAEDEKEASASKRNSHNSHLENHTNKRKRKREINLSNQSRKKIGLRIQVSCNVNYKDITERSSEQGHRVDAKAPFAEEGRD